MVSKIRFGPGGLGSVADAVSNLEEYHRLGLRACEVEFTYGAYIKKEEDAKRIGERAKELDIVLSIHAPYYVNLNSKEDEKIEASKKRILRCCEVGHFLGAKRIVFHPGFYSNSLSLEKKDSSEAKKLISEETGAKIAEGIVEMQDAIKKAGWDVELCPEVMGKVNVFGSIDEVAGLVEKTGCGFCVDIAHVLARYGEYRFDEIAAAFPAKSWHVHFSGIEYGEKGEKKHLMTPVEDWKKVVEFLKGLGKDVVVICESPDPVGDAVVGLGLA
jgi:deoxyribonuclease IV